MSVAAVVLAAGRGTRLASASGATPKGFVELAGRTLVERSIAALAAVPAIECVVPVVPADDLDRFAALGIASAKLSAAVAGGLERQDSVAAGLDALPRGATHVAVHDAARCLVRRDALERVVAAGVETGAALLAVPASDTIKRVREGLVVESPARSECWAAQTPQVFRVDWLREAHAKARADRHLGTDDAELVARLGIEVRVVEGDADNLKITHPADLETAEAILRTEEDG